MRNFQKTEVLGVGRIKSAFQFVALAHRIAYDYRVVVDHSDFSLHVRVKIVRSEVEVTEKGYIEAQIVRLDRGRLQIEFRIGVCPGTAIPQGLKETGNRSLRCRRC